MRRSWNEIVGLVAEAVAKAEPGEWIIGRGWHQEKWDEKPEPNLDGYPTHESLSHVSPNNPVLLTHASGHMSFANAYAMQLANITSDTKDPAGGEMLRTADGMPSGVFRETAQGLLARARARGPRSAEGDDDAGGGSARKAIELATQQCWRHGITTFHDAGADFGTIALFRELAESGQLGVRLYVMIRASNAALARQLDAAPASAREPHAHGPSDQGLDRRCAGSARRVAPGAVRRPADERGIEYGPRGIAGGNGAVALEHDYQLCVHAIGDKANQAVLDVYDRAFQASPAQVSRRWRIEHAQHLDPADIPRFGRLGVIASMQGIHCTSDAVYVMQRLGSRRAAQGAYVWKSLLDQGAVICNGTDVPVEAIDPIASFAASVTRKLDSGVTFFPEQCMTREQALRSYTLDAAYAAFEEDLKGSLTPGKLADLVVLSKDILTCPDDEIRGPRHLHGHRGPGAVRAGAELMIGLNERAARRFRQAAGRAARLKIRIARQTRRLSLLDFGLDAAGSLRAGIELARICTAGLAAIAVERSAEEPGQRQVRVATRDPLRACLGSQYAGWRWDPPGYFALCSGPIRAVRGP